MTTTNIQFTQADIDEFAEKIVGRVRLHADTKKWRREAEEQSVDYCRALLTQRNFDLIVIPPDLGSGIINPVNKLFWEAVSAYSDELPGEVFWGQKRGWYYVMTKKAEHKRRQQQVLTAQDIAEAESSEHVITQKMVSPIGTPVISSYIAKQIMAGMERRAQRRKAQ